MRKQTRRGVMLAGLLLAALVLVPGCKRNKVHVESNTYWDGLINGNIHIGGLGNKTYEIHGRLGCVTVQKARPDTLYLRLQINDGLKEETRAPTGVIYQCK